MSLCSCDQSLTKLMFMAKNKKTLKWCLSSMQNREALPSYQIQIIFRIISICYDRSHRFILRAYVNIVATRKEEWSEESSLHFPPPAPLFELLWYHGTSGLVLWYRRFQKWRTQVAPKLIASGVSVATWADWAYLKVCNSEYSKPHGTDFSIK